MSRSAARNLPNLEARRLRTATDQVYEALYDRVVNLTLPPGSRLSEAEVASQMGVSRQPVRDAFYRLSRLGFNNSLAFLDKFFLNSCCSLKPDLVI